MTARTRAIALGAGVLVAAALSALALAPRAPRIPGPSAAVDRDEAPPPRQRRDYPRLPDLPRTAEPTDLARAEAEARARETPTVLAPPPAVRREIPVGDVGPRAPAQSMTGWIGGYRDAVCGCRTRSCVGDLQARFLNALGSAEFDTERDQAAYIEASRQAIRCYAALPEDS